MGSKPETKFKEKVRKELDAIPRVWSVKIQQRGQRGIPDLLVCAAGKFLAFELKIDTGRADKLQEWNLSGIRRAGGYAAIVTPENWPQVLKHIKELTQ